MERRGFILGAAALPAAALLSRLEVSEAFAQQGRPADGQAVPFDGGTVRRIAKELASKPFQKPDTRLPEGLRDLSYDDYRNIRFDPQRALWRGEQLPFEVQFFHRGFLYTNHVDIHLVEEGRSRPLGYQPAFFSFDNGLKRPEKLERNLGFAGFRLHGPINRPDYYDEVAAFLGASYFRAVAKNQIYGLSARGLAIKTADPAGEEFPFFRAFWIERPRAGTNTCTVHALLDSESAAASFRFAIRPGDSTVFDVEMGLYPRSDLPQVGIAPMTSMFLFAANDRQNVDDFRPAVHDSDGLLMINGAGERLWRPLSNPGRLELSAFADVNPRGFGLMQRAREFPAYQDLEARYERRPSLWFEPIGAWGEGAVHLVEIPTKEEIHDNIVAFWRPKDPLRGKGEYNFTYRLHWCSQSPVQTELGEVVATRSGAASDGRRRFVIDMKGGVLTPTDPKAPRPANAAPPIDPQNLKADVSASRGKIANLVVQPNPDIGGWRISFELNPENADVVELRAVLMGGDRPASESWIYRWTP